MPAALVRPGVAIAYERTGSGPPLVLVHGITESRHSWDPLVPRLAESFDVLAVDLRGHGRSAKIAPFDVGTLADDLAELLAHLDLRRPHLIGHSLGGVVVSAMAATVDPTSVINVDQPLELSGFHDALAPAVPLIRGTPDEFDGFIASLFASMYGPLPAAEQHRVRAHADADQEVVNGVWSGVIDGPAAELDAVVDAILAGITAPYLSLHGADPGPEYATWLTDRCPTARVEVWPDHGHYPHLVDPERFLARAMAFTTDV
ncbi:MAG: alpha/beta hydrolase [Pseudonocardia sp.]|nr:alpha/beta hydrolase [Pseudonocardia sp.]